MPININDSIRVRFGKPLDDRFSKNGVPYNSVDDVNNNISFGERYIGLIVLVNNELYWYKNGINNQNLEKLTFEQSNSNPIGNGKEITRVSVTGDATKILTIYFSDGTNINTTFNDLTGNSGSTTVNWNDIEEKPKTFPSTPHTHNISEVNGLQRALDGKSDTNHTHVINWDDIQGKPDNLGGGIPAQHTHAIADITNLQQELDDKADVNHTHTFNWSNLDTLFELRNIKFILSNADKSKYIICNGNNMSVTINANDLNNNFECIIDNPHRHIVTIPVNGNVLGSTHGLTQPYTLAKGGSVYIYKFNNQLYIKGDVI